MKVLHLRSGGGLYGAEQVILTLARGLSAAGHEAAVMNLQPQSHGAGGLVDAARTFGLESHAVACESKLDLSAVRALTAYIRGGVDVVHSHDYKSDCYALLSSRGSNARLVTTCHNWASDKLRMRVYKAVNKLLMRRFSRIAVVSEALRRELLQSGIRGSKLVNIPNGVALEDAAPGARARVRESLGIDADEEVVITVGRLSPEKNHARLLAAARKVAEARPRSRFLIVGAGPLRAGLEAAAKSAGLGARAAFLGERRDVRDLLAAADVFILPSLKEGLPLALLEAMACRKPVIASAVGEIPAIVAHGASGLLIDPSDASALADAIVRVLANPSAAAELAAAGYRRVRDGFSAEAMVRRYLELYREALGS